MATKIKLTTFPTGSITFGKFSRAHPCNVREFKVYAGLSPDMKTMSLVHWGGLKNDSTAEEVEVAWRNAEGVVIPVEYVCVEPLSAHSSNYNISIWYCSFRAAACARADCVPLGISLWPATKTKI